MPFHVVLATNTYSFFRSFLRWLNVLMTLYFNRVRGSLVRSFIHPFFHPSTHSTTFYLCFFFLYIFAAGHFYPHTETCGDGNVVEAATDGGPIGLSYFCDSH